MNIKEALTRYNLTKISRTPIIDTEILLAHVLKKNRVFLYSHPEYVLTKDEVDIFNNIIKKRLNGVPIAYIIGTKDFWNFTLNVNEHTLIPRAETELLVEIALKLLNNKPYKKILDLGTGSGAIALALATERPDLDITAVDIDPHTVETAQINAKTLNINNIKIIQSNWFENLATELFDVIISNPPYIKAYDPHLFVEDLRFEPQIALVSGMDGLKDIDYIIKTSNNFLLSDGLLLLEHGYNQQDEVQKLFKNSNYHNIQTWEDFNHHPRVTCGYTNFD